MASKAFADLITFTRGSSATRVNSSGYIETVSSDVARIDYDPISFESRGLLLEAASTNLVTYSEALNVGSWVASNASVTANAITAPTNTTTADKLYELAVNNYHIIATNSISFTSGTKYTFSVYAKAAERSTFQLIISSTIFSSLTAFANFDLASGTTGTKGSDIESSSIVSLGNGWYRCTMSTKASPVTDTASAFICLSNTSNPSAAFPSYLGTALSGAYFWGVQLEAQAVATSYIPTTSSSVTRSADSAILSTVSPWFLSTSGSVYAEFVQPSVISGSIISLNNASSSEEIKLNISGTDPKLTVTDGGASQVSLDAGTVGSNTVYKMVITYEANSFKACINGGSVVTDTSGTLPTVDKLYLGKDGAASPEYLNGWLRKVRYYPSILTDAEMVSLTA